MQDFSKSWPVSPWDEWAERQTAHWDRIDTTRADAVIRQYHSALTPQQMIELLCSGGTN